jgi:hypothetical protein
MSVTTQVSRRSALERLLALLAAAVCLIITIVFWLSVSSYQSMWPLPGLYFIEILAFSVVSAFSFIRGDPRGQFLTWGSAGVIGTFSILAAFSVGFFYLPVSLLFAIISVTSDMRNKKHVLAHLVTFLIAGIAQLALMLVAI